MNITTRSGVNTGKEFTPDLKFPQMLYFYAFGYATLFAGNVIGPCLLEMDSGGTLVLISL